MRYSSAVSLHRGIRHSYMQPTTYMHRSCIAHPPPNDDLCTFLVISRQFPSSLFDNVALILKTYFNSTCCNCKVSIYALLWSLSDATSYFVFCRRISFVKLLCMFVKIVKGNARGVIDVHQSLVVILNRSKIRFNLRVVSTTVINPLRRY
jgi:hypothetical protein